MKTLLILAQHPELAVAIRAALNPDAYRVLHRASVEDAEPLLGGGSMDACVLDLDDAEPPATWVLDSLFRRLRQCPVLAYTSAKSPLSEEEAYLKGVAYVLEKPVRGPLLNALLPRLWTANNPPPISQSIAVLPSAPVQIHRPDELLPSAAQSLQMLKGFSALLAHSLQAEPMLRNCLQMLREILGVNRAAIFMRQPDPVLGTLAEERFARHLRSACALGIAPGLLEHFQLSFETGIGGYLHSQGRILRRDSAEAQGIEIQKEFELLGAQVAVPMLDRESLIGIATLDYRVTGEPLTSPELAMVFHLLEQVGLAIKNIWLHEQVAANHDLLAAILQDLSSGCVMISRDLVVLHANKAARKLLVPSKTGALEFYFSDLPQPIGSKIHQVFQTGTPIPAFTFQPEPLAKTVFEVRIVPFQKTISSLPYSALLIVEDTTFTVEAAENRIIRTVAERMAHEINNAVTPLDTYSQLMEEEVKKLPPALESRHFFESFHATLVEAVRRISRRGSQMRILAQTRILALESGGPKELVSLAKVLQEGYAEAQRHHTPGAPKLAVQGEPKSLMVFCDRKHLAAALMEIFLNALQANSKEPKVSLRIETETAPEGKLWVHLFVRDYGDGFTPEALLRATEPFWRTKNIGLGLGLPVALKVITLHGGKLYLSNSSEGSGAVVRLSLPLDTSSGSKE